MEQIAPLLWNSGTNCSSPHGGHLLIRKTTNKISRKNRKSISVCCHNIDGLVVWRQNTKKKINLMFSPHIPQRIGPTPVSLFAVWIPNLGALQIIALVSLTHFPCLFAFICESVSCVYDFFSTRLSNCVARAACFVWCSVLITTFCFLFFFFHKLDRHLYHGAYWCTHNLAHMPILLFRLHFHLCNSCACVCQLVYALSSLSIFIHIYRHICVHIYVSTIV